MFADRGIVHAQIQEALGQSMCQGLPRRRLNIVQERRRSKLLAVGFCQVSGELRSEIQHLVMAGDV